MISRTSIDKGISVLPETSHKPEHLPWKWLCWCCMHN